MGIKRPFQALYEERKATEIACSSHVKILLWLPKPRRDPFDAEFEAWLDVNYPEGENA